MGIFHPAQGGPVPAGMWGSQRDGMGWGERGPHACRAPSKGPLFPVTRRGRWLRGDGRAGRAGGGGRELGTELLPWPCDQNGARRGDLPPPWHRGTSGRFFLWPRCRVPVPVAPFGKTTPTASGVFGWRLEPAPVASEHLVSIPLISGCLQVPVPTTSRHREGILPAAHGIPVRPSLRSCRAARSASAICWQRSHSHQVHAPPPNTRDARGQLCGFICAL